MFIICHSIHGEQLCNIYSENCAACVPKPSVCRADAQSVERHRDIPKAWVMILASVRFVICCVALFLLCYPGEVKNYYVKNRFNCGHKKYYIYMYYSYTLGTAVS